MIGRGPQARRGRSLPFVAIPTTAGTGAEVTRNAVLASRRGTGEGQPAQPAACCPRLAIVDPDLLLGLPPAVLAASGLDALSQLIEPFLSARANPLTDALAREGIRARRRARCAARPPRPRAIARPAARTWPWPACSAACAWPTPAWAPCTASPRPPAGMFAAPHGAVCAALLAPVMAVNLRALRARAPEHPALARSTELAPLLTGRPEATAADAIAWVASCVARSRSPGSPATA